MHNHRINSFLIADNVRLEIVHETNPNYAGEHISLMVRLRHLGSMEKYSMFKDTIEELHKDLEQQINNQSHATDNNDNRNDNDKKGPWLMNSLFHALKRDSKDDMDIKEKLEEQQFKDYVTKEIQYHKPVDLMAGFVQIMGIFQYDPEIIDRKTFKTSSNKIIGIGGPTDSKSKNNNMNSNDNGTNTDQSIATQDKQDIQKYFQSSFKFGPRRLNTFIDNDSFPLANFQDFLGEYEQLPFLIIPQSLLFPELTLEPGEVKSFHFKSDRLPKNLCPSYTMSKNLSINYQIEFGVSKVEPNSIVRVSMKVPIFVAPLVTSKGYQYTATLGDEPFIMKPATIKEVYQSHSSKRSHSVGSVLFSRRKSLNSITYNQPIEHIDKLKENFINLIKTTEKFDDIEDLVDSQLDIQFGKSDESETDQTDFESNFDLGNTKLAYNNTDTSTRTNIINLKRFPIESLSDEETSFYASKFILPQFVNIQKDYILNRNGQLIATISFSKPFYTVTDDIDMTIHLSHNSHLSVSGIAMKLNMLEVINPKYLSDSAKDDLREPKSTTIATSQAISFDDSESITFKLTMPKTPMNLMTSQFKSNIFQVKWALYLKFILIPESSSSNTYEFYEDKKGILFHSAETIEGEEFNCRIPVVILPSCDDFGGW